VLLTPHSTFDGQTPNEVYNGTSFNEDDFTNLEDDFTNLMKIAA